MELGCIFAISLKISLILEKDVVAPSLFSHSSTGSFLKAVGGSYGITIANFKYFGH